MEFEKTVPFLIEFDKKELNEMEDRFNANIEVFVTLEDGFTVTIIVGTPENLQYIMEKDNVNFYGPGLPWIIVQELTKEIIEEAIEAFIAAKEKNYWLKLYHFATEIDISVFDQLQAKEIIENDQFTLLTQLDSFKEEIQNTQTLNKSTLLANFNKLYQYV